MSPAPPGSPRLAADEIDHIAGGNPLFAALEAGAGEVEGDSNTTRRREELGEPRTTTADASNQQQHVASTACDKPARPAQPPAAAAEAAGARFTCPAAYLDDAEPRSDDDGDAKMDPAQVLLGFLDGSVPSTKRPGRATTAAALRTETVLRFSPLLPRAAKSGKSSLLLPSFAADSVTSFSVPMPSSPQGGATGNHANPN